MDNRERGSHARDVHPTQDTSRMDSKSETGGRSGRRKDRRKGRNVGTKGIPEKDPISSEDLPIVLPEID